MLMGFHDADAGHTDLIERTVVAAAAVTIKTVDEHHVEVREILIGLRFDVARKVARGAIHFTACKPT